MRRYVLPQIQPGDRFGRMTAVDRYKDGPKYRWHLRCECGESATARGDYLRQGRVRSCGCARHDLGPKLEEPCARCKERTREPSCTYCAECIDQYGGPAARRKRVTCAACGTRPRTKHSSYCQPCLSRRRRELKDGAPKKQKCEPIAVPIALKKKLLEIWEGMEG